MKTIGLLGGMSWESTVSYYQIINETVKKKLGGFHSAKILLYSFNFEEIERLLEEVNWNEIGRILVEKAIALENAGADIILICTNTMHKSAEEIQKNLSIPLLHIADSAGEKIRENGVRTIGLLGTKFLMEEDFYRRRLKEKFNISVLIPDEKDRKIIHTIIFKELVLGIIEKSSQKKMLNIIEKIVRKGAEGILLGCTEIPLLIKQENVNVPLFDTTTLHALNAVEKALE